ncbi:trans-aconitate 2-methyltransferase [uncultured Pseudokineococcus sp.]|uniref:class I SAM-dependent methyltransferase n=1 Tax=uncultured Pseudokineococcus sp. TaxID=1642928 RepID=UPI0026238B28|nr:methyltransferase domain-containing protein [uncultured Pseudokineococcus sp.]
MSSSDDGPSEAVRSAAAGDVTLESYQAAADVYRDQTPSPGPAVAGFLDEVARRVGSGSILEMGSGPGADATYLEARGPRVVRTDAVPAFVQMLRADGHQARVLDVRVDDLGGPYAGVLANAVLLHLTREEVADVLTRARDAVVDGGVLAITLKEGDGDAWTSAKLGLPRHFTYWREPQLRAVLEATGWSDVVVDHVAGRDEAWLFVLALAARHAPAVDHGLD